MNLPASTGHLALGQLATLLVTDEQLLDVDIECDDALGLRDLHGIVGDYHELGNGRPPENGVVCHLEVGHLEADVLGPLILLAITLST